MTISFHTKYNILLILFFTMNLVTLQAHAANCTSNCLSLYNNSLTDLGTSLRATVKLVDEFGSSGASRSSTVHGLWTRPDGSTVLQYARIGTRLRADFNFYTGGASGNYSFEVIDVIKSGYTFDDTTGGDLIVSITTGSTNNQLPVAILNTNTTSGSAPLTIDFDSTGSLDPDGGSLIYFWNFGDGTTSSEQIISHVYSVNGEYTATLNVTDSAGATVNSSVNISVIEPSPTGSTGCLNQCISVDEYAMDYKPKKDLIRGIVRLMDENAEPVYDVTVKATWTLPDGSTVSQSRNNRTKNKAVFKIPANTEGTYKLTVTNINKFGYSHTPENDSADYGAYNLVF
ncbi:MAG: PKD domain-containing protein [Candidatus Thiodiazotropha sp. (ex Lucinoma borealis)]|nr:PKD domain-containing protein [Candidatus Thiodiazotropha sp. (ex Lucinoma borealis)]